MSRYAHTFFCDDVRAEIGRKNSYIGVYNDKMLTSALPGTISKLCTVVHISTPLNQAFENISVRGVFRGQAAFEMFLNPEEIRAMDASLPPPGPDAHSSFIQLMAVLSPFQIEGPGKLTVEVIADGERLYCAGLEIDVASPADIQENPFI